MAAKKKPAKKNWMKTAVKKPGALHEDLGIPKDQKIPASKLKIKPGDSALLKKRKTLAKTFKKARRK